MNNRGPRTSTLLLLFACLVSLPLQAASWFPLGPFGGDARAFAADPLDSKHLYLGTATGWVYESHDGGSTWGRLSQISSRNDLVIDHILADKRNPRRLIVGAWKVTGVDGGIFISQDGGKTWFAQIEMNGQSVRSLARSSSNPNEVVAGTLAGVFRSVDNGIHWRPIVPEANNGEIHNVQSIAIDPADPAVIYAGTWHLPWKTTDGGQNWIPITAKQHIIDDSDVFSILVDPADPKIVYASACSGIYKSVDAAGDFKKIQGIPNTARRTRKLMQDPQHLNTIYAGTTEGLYRTLDGGDHWDRMTASDVIVNDVYVDPANSSHVLLATDHGGVLLSDDEAATFQPSNTGFSARQVAAYASDPQNPALLYVGVVNDKETGGVFQSSDGGLRWQQQSTGLGGRDVFSLVTTPEGVLLAGTNRGIYRLESGTWVDSSELAGTTHARALARPVARPAPKPPAHKPAPHKTAFVYSSRPRFMLAGLTVRQTATPPAHTPVKKPAHAVAKPAANSAKSKKVVAHKPLPRPATKLQTAHAASPAPRPAAAHVSTQEPAQVPSPTAVASPDAGQSLAPAPTMISDRLNARVYALAAGESSLYAGTSEGLFRGPASGRIWTRVAGLDLPEVRFISNRDTTLLASGLKAMALSTDAGVTWKPISLPHGLTQVGALSLDGRNGIWVGGREGLFYSTDAGLSWQQLPNFSISQVDAIFYDASADRILATTAESTFVYSVHVPDLKLVYWDTGWKLRFARPVGDYLIGATLYDGVVVQPRMVESSRVTTKPQLPATPAAQVSAR
jgi:photosystem II stability/assembly factor-like uncharacterized protein